MLNRIASILGLAEEPVTAPHLETRQVRLDARPRRCEQTYGAPYLALSCSDGTVAILLDADTHGEFAGLRPGSEITMRGRWAPTHQTRHRCDRIFHVEGLA